MKRRGAPEAVSRAATALALLAGLACAGAPAHAGSLTVRDTNGAWTVGDDPQADANDFLLKHLINGTSPDDRFGRHGETAFTLGANNDPPSSVRVDATHRTWMVGASLAGNQPQPVIARFKADGYADLGWGVQGKLQLTPAGVAIKPNDLLPLADGSVLVAGEVTGVATPRAAVFHVNANGSLDRNFGAGGVWQRADDGDASTATSLAASTDGTAAVAVAVRGAKPGAELWSLSDVAPAVIQRKPMEDNSDGEDLRVEWSTDHWVLSNGGGTTPVVPPALLTNHPPSHLAPVAASDPGEGGFNPFAAVAASAPTATGDEDGLPWTWIAIAAGVLAAAAGAFALRARKPATVLRKPPSH
jgi:hypothetical protein